MTPKEKAEELFNMFIIIDDLSDSTGNSLNIWYNTPGTYFTDNGFSSYFSLNSNVSTNTGLNVSPFLRVYNRMFTRCFLFNCTLTQVDQARYELRIEYRGFFSEDNLMTQSLL